MIIKTKGLRVETKRLQWRKSTRSNPSGNSVEVAAFPSGVATRDSKNPDSGTQIYTTAEWKAFTGAVKDGEFDFPA